MDALYLLMILISVLALVGLVRACAAVERRR